LNRGSSLRWNLHSVRHPTLHPKRWIVVGADRSQ
jgi:hypothetical protein